MRTSIHGGGTGNIRHSQRNGFTAYGRTLTDRVALAEIQTSSWLASELREKLAGEFAQSRPDIAQLIRLPADRGIFEFDAAGRGPRGFASWSRTGKAHNHPTRRKRQNSAAQAITITPRTVK
jgi:hypothetical protein